MSKLRVYTASCLRHADGWKYMANDNQEIEWVARWPTEHCSNVPDNSAFARWFWSQDFEDVARADVVLVFAEGNDNLRGALVEAGIGIALHKRIIVVGEHVSYGTWQYHPSVVRVKDLPDALETLRLYSKHGIGHFRD